MDSMNEINVSSEHTSSARRVDVKIPVAVFTAKRGYDWTKLPKFVSQDEADRLYEEVGILKAGFLSDLSVGDVFKGVIFKSEYAFAFRLQIVEKWDQANRDANYCAAAFIPLENLSDIDLGRLLDMDYFTVPNKAPGDALHYIDEDYSEPDESTWIPILQNLIDGKSEDFSWSLIGPMLAKCHDANAMWAFVRMCCKSDMRFAFKHETWNYEAKCFKPQDPPSAPSPDNSPITDEEIPVAEMPPVVPESPVEANVIPQTNDAASIITELKRRIEELKIQNDALRSNEQLLSQRLQNQSKSVERANIERDEARRLADEYSRRLRYNSLQQTTKPTESKADLMIPSITFLLGVLIAGVIFLVVSIVSQNKSTQRLMPDPIADGSSVTNSFKEIDGVGK